MGLTGAQVKEQLIGLFPPGTERLIDWGGEPGELLAALAETVRACGTDRLDRAQREVSPLTTRELLPFWEATTGLAGSPIAQMGTTAQRQAQVLSRVRGKGPPTLAKIRAVIAPLLDYADPSTLVVMEPNRAAQRLLHTYNISGIFNFSMIAASLSWTVADRGKVSKGGAQVDVTMSHPDLSKCAATLTAPDGRTATVNPFGRGSGVGTFRLHFATMAGAAIAGTWTILIGATVGVGQVTSADLFVEGVGRVAGLDGLAAPLGDWAVQANPALMGPNANIEAAKAGVRFIDYATRNGGLVRKSTVPAAVCVVPDEDAAIPDECVPC